MALVLAGLGGFALSSRIQSKHDVHSKLSRPSIFASDQVDARASRDPMSMLAAQLLAMPRHGHERRLQTHRSYSQNPLMRVRPKGMRPGPNYERPERIVYTGDVGERDVVVKLWNIGNPELAQVMSVLSSKKGYWFPKLSIAVGDRTWSYDGRPEATYDAIIASASGEPPIRVWNLGATTKSDEEIDAMIAEMAATDYATNEYDFFFRNCNHFCVDLAERLAPDSGGWSPEDMEFVDSRVLAESEAILNNMPSFQEKLTRSVTFQVQKVIIKAWRKEWKRALAEYEEKEGIPEEKRVKDLEEAR